MRARTTTTAGLGLACLLLLLAPTARGQGIPAGPGEEGPHVSRELKVELDRSDDNVVRTGPGEGYAIAGVYPKGAQFPVLAKKGDWYNVQLAPDRSGWVHRSLCREFVDLGGLEFRPNPRMFSRIGALSFTGYGGAYAFDRKSNSLVLGGRFGYYLFDRLEVEGSLAWSHIVRPAEIVESLFELRLTEEEFHMLGYQLGLVYKLLPGRQLVPFVSFGAGSVIMQGEVETALSYGAGTNFFLMRNLATRWEFRVHRFDSGFDDARRHNQNIEFSLGTSLLF